MSTGSLFKQEFCSLIFWMLFSVVRGFHETKVNSVGPILLILHLILRHVVSMARGTIQELGCVSPVCPSPPSLQLGPQQLSSVYVCDKQSPGPFQGLTLHLGDSAKGEAAQ